MDELPEDDETVPEEEDERGGITIEPEEPGAGEEPSEEEKPEVDEADTQVTESAMVEVSSSLSEVVVGQGEREFIGEEALVVVVILTVAVISPRSNLPMSRERILLNMVMVWPARECYLERVCSSLVAFE